MVQYGKNPYNVKEKVTLHVSYDPSHPSYFGCPAAGFRVVYRHRQRGIRPAPRPQPGTKDSSPGRPSGFGTAPETHSPIHHPFHPSPSGFSPPHPALEAHLGYRLLPGAGMAAQWISPAGRAELCSRLQPVLPPRDTGQCEGPDPVFRPGRYTPFGTLRPGKRLCGPPEERSSVPDAPQPVQQRQRHYPPVSSLQLDPSPGDPEL